MDIKRFDPDKLGERSLAAYRALYFDGTLADGTCIWDGQWHEWRAVVAKMMSASDIQAKSCCDIIRGLEYRGEVMRRGSYSSKADRRELLFIDLSPLDSRDGYTDEEWAAAVKEDKRIRSLHQEALSQARQRYG